MYAALRQETIAEEILSHGAATVAELAERHGVSAETVRRDLAVLERDRRISRVHGGAVPYRRGSGTENSVTDRERLAHEAKIRIAATAADLLPQTGSVIVDAGTTTVLLDTEIIARTDLSVVTNSLTLAHRLSAADHRLLRIVGGRVRGVTQAVVGADAVADFERLRADIAFLGANGVTAGFGLSTPDPSEGQTKAAMTRSARTRVALVDATKLGEELLYSFARPTDIDALVTDAPPDHPVIRELTTHGLDVIHA
ncbi:DeoR/GlpR family DNA-binding transcription regulator [Corynebacterium terpenotabidum]|uniref:Lactose phosphotransferase system repressor n=1 Tax=Corynebacterium terpenotabidum Y-11 TaxID=1200352 RepID=S4XDX5_9CORY|nr:DeoR/GlpR family DNA-binding transcription regulator [Corynebacterium terpenotabidum]AGP31352.1 DeoR DNA-binding transcription regulator [Corynebacterium terpenotabidum Y-11]